MPNYALTIIWLSFGIVLGVLDALARRVEQRRWTLRSKFDLVFVAALIVLGLVDALFDRNDPAALKPMSGGLGWDVLLALLLLVYVGVVMLSARRLQRALRMQRDERDRSPTIVAPPEEEGARR